MAKHFVEIGRLDEAGASVMEVGIHPPVPKYVVESAIGNVVLPKGSRVGDVSLCEDPEVPYTSIEVHTLGPDDDAGHIAALAAGQLAAALAARASTHRFEIDWEVKNSEAGRLFAS